MQKTRSLIFPVLTLCFLLVLGGYFLGRRSVCGVILTTQHPVPIPAERQSSDPGEIQDRSVSPAADNAPASFDALGRLDLNHATLEELVTLPGIGEVRARRILDYRKQHGPFQSASDLMQVRGIGEGIYSKLRDLIYVEDSNENSDY